MLLKEINEKTHFYLIGLLTTSVGKIHKNFPPCGWYITIQKLKKLSNTLNYWEALVMIDK